MKGRTKEKEAITTSSTSKNKILVLLKSLVKVNNIPAPWNKATGAGVCTIVPLLLSYLYQKPQWGSIGMLGALVYLYTSNETYGRRSRKMIYVMCGFTAISFLGGITSNYILLQTIIIGLIGGLGIFVFGVNRIQGPTALFFVLVYLLTSVKPITFTTTIENTIVMLLSCVFATMISMIGIVLHPRKKEEETVRRIYYSIAMYGQSIGSSEERNIRNRTVSSLKESEEMLLTAHGAQSDSEEYKKLLFFNLQGNRLFHILLELSHKIDVDDKVDGNILQFIEILPELLLAKKEEDVLTCFEDRVVNHPYYILQEETTDELVHVYNNMLVIIVELLDYMKETNSAHLANHNLKKPKKSMKFKEEFRKESIVTHKSVRYGIVLIIASLVSICVPFAKSYWITLSCASVMLGGTVVLTRNRAIQRSLGTFLGIWIAGIVLSYQPHGLGFILTATVLSMIIELFIVKNYAFAMIFITVNGLLIAEHNTPIDDLSIFYKARMINVLIGSIIGLIGTVIISRRSASSRLNASIVAVLEKQKVVIDELSNGKTSQNNSLLTSMQKMDISLKNVKDTYSMANGEMRKREYQEEEIWTLIGSLEYMNYILRNLVIHGGTMNISEEERVELLSLYDSMMTSIASHTPMEKVNAVCLDRYMILSYEIHTVQNVLNSMNHN